MASLSLSLTSAPHLRFITYRSYTNCPTCRPDSDSAHPFPLPLIVSPELSEVSFRRGAAGAGEGGGCQPSRRAPGTRPVAGGAAAGSRRCPIGAGQPAGGSRVSRGLIPRALARAFRGLPPASGGGVKGNPRSSFATGQSRWHFNAFLV